MLLYCSRAHPAGMGSCLPRLGLTAQQLDAILNRADTETAHEAFANFKATKEMQDKNPGVALGDVKRKTSTAKRKRSSLAENVSAGADGDSQAESSRVASDRQSVAPSVIPSEPFNTIDDYSYLFGSYDGNNGAAQFGPNQSTGLTPWLGPQTASADGQTLGQSSGQAAGQAPGPGSGPGPGASHPDYGARALINPYTGDLLSYGQINANNIVPGFAPQSHLTGMQSLFNNSGFGTTGTAGSYPFPTMASTLGDQKGSQPNSESSDQSPNTVEDKQRRLREAVANLATGKTQGLGTGVMSPEEMDQRQRAFEALKSSLDEDQDWNDRKTEIIQLFVYHLNK